MTAALGLSPNIFVTAIRERAVLLDLRKDRYVALNADLARAALAIAGCTMSAPLTEEALSQAAAALQARGFLTTGGGSRGVLSDGARTPKPTVTAWPSVAALRSRIDLLVSAQFALLEAWLSLRFLSFEATVERVARRAAARTVRHSDQVVLDAFVAARPWFWAKPICRLDAIALCLHLRRYGHDANLVFGVRLDPFKAHCWVQRDTRVLNEPHEIVARYAPIMVA